MRNALCFGERMSKSTFGPGRRHNVAAGLAGGGISGSTSFLTPAKRRLDPKLAG